LVRPEEPADGLANIAEAIHREHLHTHARREEFNLAFNPNWAPVDPKEIGKVMEDVRKLDVVSGDLWDECQQP
jgi:hypothetical protein